MDLKAYWLRTWADSGTFDWAARRRQPRTGFANNEFIAEVGTGPRRLISYRHADGD